MIQQQIVNKVNKSKTFLISSDEIVDTVRINTTFYLYQLFG